MSGQADIVKKSCLKVKVVRGKASSSVVLQGPKMFRDYWFVFRALMGGDKILEYHQNEKKFLESAAYPKGVFHLGTALAVSYHNPEKKQQFSIELSGGSLIFLEAGSEALAREWMVCLNAVLFGKGTGSQGSLQYFVEVAEGSRLQYKGQCMLEVKNEELTVKTSDGTANLARWKLAHIRSFKAKKDMLTVFSGSRSSTGVGEYQFQTSQSVQITHAIETVVKKLKLESLGSSQQDLIPQHSLAHSISAPGLIRTRPFTSERRRPLPPPPPPPSHPAPSPGLSPPDTPTPSEISSLGGVPEHIPREYGRDNNGRSNVKRNIPPFRNPEYSTVESEGQRYELGYERLDRQMKSRQRSTSPPSQPSKGYSRLSHKTSPGPSQRSSRSTSRSRSPTPCPAPDGEYHRLDHGTPVEEEYGKLDHGVGSRGGTNPNTPGEEEYGKLDHGVGGVVSGGVDEGGYGKLDYSVDTQSEVEAGYSKLGTPAPKPQKKLPPLAQPPPFKPRPVSPVLNLLRKKRSNEQLQTVQSHQLPPEDGDMYSEVAPSVPNPGVSDGYGRLNHLSASHPFGTISSSDDPAGYGRLGATPIAPPTAPPTLDPYASLSDSVIERMTKEEQGGSEGEYSELGVVTNPGPTYHQPVDSLGYSKPWASYTDTVNTPHYNNITPQPAVRSKVTQNGVQATGPGAEFEVLYDKCEVVEDLPPTPPPRRDSRSKRSPAPLPVGAGARGGGSKPPPRLPKPRLDIPT